MIEQNPSHNLAARPRAAWACCGVASARSRTLILLASWLAVVTPLHADNPPTYVFEIDASAASGGFYPAFVALDSSNNVYVSDGGNDRIVKFSGGGTYLTQWGVSGAGNGQFDNPTGIAVDSSNNVYVADWQNNRIEKFSSSGTYLAQWGSPGTNNGQFEYPEGMAVDSSNNVYVADRNNSRIEKFSNSGTYLAQWGSLGTNNGQFGNPEVIAVDNSNNFYVADEYNYRIEKFTSSGTYLTQWGSFGSGNGQFYSLAGVAVDSSNNVYVADGNNRIEKFTSSGNYLTQWGSYGSGTGQFEGPQGVAVDSAGNYIYVSDEGNSRIDVFVNDTNIIPPYIVQQPTNQTVPAGTNVTLTIGVVGAALSYQWSSNNVAVDGATNAAFTLTNVSLSDSAAYAVLVSNGYGSALSSNAVLTVLPAADFLAPTYFFEIDSGAVPGGFVPSFVALDSSNNIYVSDSENGRVLKFGWNGAYLAQWGSAGASPGHGPGQLESPEGIAVDSGNNVYVADAYNYRVEKFDSDGNYLAQWGSIGTGPGQFYEPVGVAVDSSNNVYVADNFNRNVQKFSGSGDYVTQWGVSGLHNGIAVDSSDNVYVVDGLIEKFDRNGNYLRQWGISGAPAGIAVSSSDDVYVVDSTYMDIDKVTSDGANLAQWGGYGGADGFNFDTISGIAVDRTGNFVCVADSLNHRIQVFVNNTNIVPPIITQQPVGQTVLPGTNVTFSVGLFFATPFSYQWTSNNVPVPGATNATFTLTNVSLSDSGNYAVLVTNDFGSEWSSNAVLSVLPVADFLAPAYLFEIGSNAAPGAGFEPSFVVLDSSNNVYVTDRGNARVVKFDHNGNYLTQWGILGSGNGQFQALAGIAVDNTNDVYVADVGNNRIEKFTSNGNYLTQWGSSGTNNEQFNDPEGVAVDSSNNVYVVDYGNCRVEKFGPNGNYLTQWGSRGSGNGQLYYPAGVAADRSDNVYVVDEGNDRVEKFTSNGNYVTQWGGDDDYLFPIGIAVDSGNYVYVDDLDNAPVEKFDGNGNYLTQWGSPGSGNGQIGNPQGIAVDSTGNFIYVADSGNDRIDVFVNNTNIVPPIITPQPANQTVVAGFNVTFSVGVAGTAPFAFQWTSNNVAVSGATNATFTLTNVSLSASGVYSVLVTNGLGSDLSSGAMLDVLPALVTTQTASDLSATGAVLNGSVTVGSEETVAWFDWGADTNYGNLTDATIVPGNSGSTNLSVALIGLPGNIYHYRLDATNDLGIVYGQDQSFTVGFAPGATTLPPTNGANGATLEAAVNPEGWDTTVYFQWETTPTLTNTTPGIDMGAGSTSLNVSSYIPGLASSTPYQYQVVASNALGTAVGKVVIGGAGQYHYFFSGSETIITLPPGTYIITAYGAPGGGGYAGLGAEMSGEFTFSTSTNLTLLVGGGGGAGTGGFYTYGGGGGGGSFVVEGGAPLVIAGGGGGSGTAPFTGYVVSENGNSYAGGAGGNVTTGGNGGPSYGGGAGGYYGSGGLGGSGYGGDDGGGGGFYTGGGGYGSGYSFENGGYGGGGEGMDDDGGYGGGGGGGGSLVYVDGLSAIEGGGGGGGGYSGGGGGGGYGGGGGGGSIIDSSAIAILAEVSGIDSPDGVGNGEIIVIALPPPSLAIANDAAFGFTNGLFGFNVAGPSGSNAVIQASTDLKTWIPLQTNLLGSGPFYFSDPQSTTNVQRFYRAQLLP